jgi:hypothetical protein
MSKPGQTHSTAPLVLDVKNTQSRTLHRWRLLLNFNLNFWSRVLIHIARQYGSRCNIDSFLLNKKGLEEVSILPKNFCNMHIARRNMHIAIESILPLTHTTPQPLQNCIRLLGGHRRSSEDDGTGRNASCGALGGHFRRRRLWSAMVVMVVVDDR